MLRVLGRIFLNIPKSSARNPGSGPTQSKGSSNPAFHIFLPVSFLPVVPASLCASCLASCVSFNFLAGPVCKVKFRSGVTSLSFNCSGSKAVEDLSLVDRANLDSMLELNL